MQLRARFERRARGWSVPETAARARLDPRDVEDIEQNRHPSVEALRALASLFGYAESDAHVLLLEVPVGDNEVPPPPDLVELIQAAARERRR
jgi:transcriptional regulator with XRE-family HTH domain